jgi:hypothetical protein
MELNVPPDLETLSTNAFPAAAIQALKMYCVALLRLKMPKKTGRTKR